MKTECRSERYRPLIRNSKDSAATHVNAQQSGPISTFLLTSALASRSSGVAAAVQQSFGVPALLVHDATAGLSLSLLTAEAPRESALTAHSTMRERSECTCALSLKSSGVAETKSSHRQLHVLPDAAFSRWSSQEVRRMVGRHDRYAPPLMDPPAQAAY